MPKNPYKELLRTKPVPPPELQLLLLYLSDAFTLLEEWIRRPGNRDPQVLQPDEHLHANGPTARGRSTTSRTTRSHLGTSNGRIALLHPADNNGTPGWIETYERSPSGASALLHDIGVRAVAHTQARSQWNTWTREKRYAEEIRIALRDVPGYYVQCPLDAAGAPLHTIATLERAARDEDPDGARTNPIPMNDETDYLLRMLTACVYPQTS